MGRHVVHCIRRKEECVCEIMMVMDVQWGIEKEMKTKVNGQHQGRLVGNEAQDARSFNVCFFILVRCFIKDQLKLIFLNLGPFQILLFRSPIR